MRPRNGNFVDGIRQGSPPCFPVSFLSTPTITTRKIRTWGSYSQLTGHDSCNSLNRRVMWPLTEHTDHFETDFEPTGGPSDDQEMLFIWYHRIKLGHPWCCSCESFHCQFPKYEECKIRGLQYKLYTIPEMA